MGGQLSLTVLLLTAGLLIGELGLIPLPGREDDAAEVRMSTPFSVALLVTGPLALVVSVYSVAVLLADLRARRPVRRMALGVGRSVLAVWPGDWSSRS